MFLLGLDVVALSKRLSTRPQLASWTAIRRPPAGVLNLELPCPLANHRPDWLVEVEIATPTSHSSPSLPTLSRLRYILRVEAHSSPSNHKSNLALCVVLRGPSTRV